MSGDQSVAGLRRYLAEVLGEFAAMEFDRMLAEAEQRGREDNADHSMCYVSGSKALAGREAEARRDALTEAADAGPSSTATDQQLWRMWLRDRAKDTK